MKFLLIHICLLIAASGFCDAPWLECTFTFSRYSTDHIWNKSGKLISTCNQFSKQDYELQGRYYMNANNCVSAKVSYVQIEDKLNKNARGISDPEIHWTHCFYRGFRQTLSTQLLAICPGGPTKDNLRYGKFAGELGLLYSAFQPVCGHDVFLDASLGYRIYQGFPSDQLRGYAALSTFLHPRFYLETSCELDYGVFNGKAQVNRPIILLNANYRLLKAQIRGVAHVYSLFYVAGGYFQHVWGRNVGTRGGWKVEAWLDF